MGYQQEISDCIKLIESLENSFLLVKNETVLSISFFSQNHDRINQLKEKLNQLEDLQFRKKEESEKIELFNEENYLPKECTLFEETNQEKIIEEKETEDTYIEETGIIQEKAYSGFLGDQISKKIFTDIRSSLSLNDKFRFLHNLFKGNVELMNETLDHLNNLNSIQDALLYIQEHFEWEEESESAQALKEIIEKRFY